MKVLIAIPLPGALNDQMEELREAYRAERWVRRNGPHVTLVPPINVSDFRQLGSSIYRPLGELAEAQRAFELSFDGISEFIRDEAGTILTLHAKIRLTPELEMLREEVIRIFEPFAPATWLRYDYVPHVTLANKVPKDEVEHWRERARQLPLAQPFSCTCMAVYLRDHLDLEADNERRQQWAEGGIFQFRGSK